MGGFKTHWNLLFSSLSALQIKCTTRISGHNTNHAKSDRKKVPNVVIVTRDNPLNDIGAHDTGHCKRKRHDSIIQTRIRDTELLRSKSRKDTYARPITKTDTGKPREKEGLIALPGKR